MKLSRHHSSFFRVIQRHEVTLSPTAPLRQTCVCLFVHQCHSLSTAHAYLPQCSLLDCTLNVLLQCSPDTEPLPHLSHGNSPPLQVHLAELALSFHHPRKQQLLLPLKFSLRPRKWICSNTSSLQPRLTLTPLSTSLKRSLTKLFSDCPLLILNCRPW